jgi:hypothetical protein
MSDGVCEIHSIEELRQFVAEILCDQHQLEMGAFNMTEEILLRGKRPCGMYFCLHGPRAVKFSAIWEIDGNRILFYGASGERFQKVQLSEAPRLERAAA